MDADMVEKTPQYRIFIDQYAAGTGPIALAVAQNSNHEEAITEKLGTQRKASRLTAPQPLGNGGLFLRSHATAPCK